MNVNDLMTTDIQCCTPDMTLDQVAMMMWEGDCGSVPVIDENNCPIGIVTDRDIAMSCALNHKAPWEISTSMVTGNREIFTCASDDSLQQAITTMQERKVRRLPVVDADGHLAGMLSIDDIVSRSEKGKVGKELSLDATMSVLKAVAFHH